MNLASLLVDHPFPDDAELVHTVDQSMTAGSARARAHAIADQLAVRPGHAVAVQLANGPELVATMIGVWLAGGVYVPVNPRLPDSERDDVLAATR
ncbi:MAG: AMP-binding protein, partial [Acidimicrobiia bacterium]